MVKDHPKLKGDDKLRYIVTLINTYFNLEMEKEMLEAMAILKEIQPGPKIEICKNYVIVRNIPECDCSRQLIKTYIAFAFCENEEDVKIINGILIAKRKV